MSTRASRTRGGKLAGLVTAWLLAYAVIGASASPAFADLPELPLPDLPDLALPDPPELPLPDPGDLPLPDLDELPVPDVDDLPLPDVDDPPVPDPDDLPIPDPDDLPVPDPDPGDDPTDKPGDGPGDKDRPRGDGARKSSPSRGASGGALDDATLAALAVAGGGSSIGPADASKSTQDEQREVIEALAPYAFPVVLLVAVAAFLALQGYFDRRDPKLAIGPVVPDDHFVTFE